MSMLSRTICAAPSARGITRSLAPALSRSLRTTGARLADDVAPAGGGLTLNFNLPSKTLYSEASVEMVILPGGDGMFGVMPNHVPTITELKPGVVSVQRVVCGGCQDFKVIAKLEAAKFADWEAAAFAPEAEFLKEVEAIPGVKKVETQTFTLEDL